MKLLVWVVCGLVLLVLWLPVLGFVLVVRSVVTKRERIP